MYAALLDEKLIWAADVTDTMGQRKFLCPKCLQPVIFVKNNHEKNYFKHTYQANQNPETIEHKNAKGLIKSALSSLGIPAKLEVPLANNQLRADVLITSSHQNFAVEIQCAPLPTSEYQRRHHLYHVEGVKDIWVLGERHFLKNKPKQIHFDLVQHNDKWRSYLLEIDLKRQKIRLKYNLQWNPVTRQIHFQQKSFSIDEYGIFCLITYQPKIIKRYDQHLDKDLEHLIKQSKQKTQMGLRFAKFCYEQQIAMADFDSSLLPGFTDFGQNKKSFLEDSQGMIM